MRLKEHTFIEMLEWFDTPNRKPSHIMFTVGEKRHIGYLMEYAERKANEEHYN